MTFIFFFTFYVHHWRSFSPHNHWWLSSYASLQFWQCQSSSPNMTFEGIFKQVGWYQPWHNEHCTMTSLLWIPAHTMDTDSGLSKLLFTQFCLYFEFYLPCSETLDEFCPHPTLTELTVLRSNVAALVHMQIQLQASHSCCYWFAAEQ